MNENQFPQLKSPDDLKNQLEKADEIIGEPLLPIESQYEAAFTPSEFRTLKGQESDLKELFPIKYKAYVAALKELHHLDDSKETIDKEGGQDLKGYATRVRAINNLEQVTRSLGSDEQKVALREHQFDVFHDLLTFLQSDKEKGWIRLPTGYGKTVIFVTLIKATNLRAVILVPSKDLVRQTREEFALFAPEIETSVYYGDEKGDPNSQVVISTYQSAETLEEVTKAAGSSHDLIINDEAHRTLTVKRINKIIEGFAKDKILIGLTATPRFSEHKDVAEMYENLIHETQLLEAIREGFLAPARCIFVKTDIDLSDVTITAAGEYDENELEKALDQEKRNLAAIQIMKMPSSSGKGIAAFCLSVAHAQKLARLAKDQGIRAAAVWGDMDDTEREQTLLDFKEGRIDVICSRNLLLEGWNAPRAKIGLYLAPTHSLVVAEQRGGRIERPLDDQEAIHYDFIDAGNEEISLLTPGVTMLDILDGNIRVPKDTIENTDIRMKPESPGFHVDINLEGIEIITDSKEMLRLLHRDKASTPEEVLKTPEDVRNFLMAAGFPDAESMVNLGESNMMARRYSTDELSITGRSLVRYYLKNILGKPDLHEVNAPQAREFLFSLFGEGIRDDYMVKVKISRATAPDIRRFLESALTAAPEEVLTRTFLVGPSSSKGEVTGKQILENMGRHHKIGDLIPERAEYQLHDYDLMRQLALFAYGEMELKTYMDAWRSWSGKDDMLPGETMEVKQKPNLPFQEIVEGLRLRVRKYIEEGRRTAFYMPMSSFLDHTFEYRKEKVTGREIMTLQGYELTHTDYRKFIDELTGKEGFCREFWPKNYPLLRKIVIDSLRTAGHINDQGKAIFPSAAQFANLKLDSEWLSAMGPKNGRRLLGMWNASRSIPDSAKEFRERNPQPEEIAGLYQAFKEKVFKVPPKPVKNSEK